MKNFNIVLPSEKINGSIEIGWWICLTPRSLYPRPTMTILPRLPPGRRSPSPHNLHMVHVPLTHGKFMIFHVIHVRTCLDMQRRRENYHRCNLSVSFAARKNDKLKSESATGSKNNHPFSLLSSFVSPPSPHGLFFPLKRSCVPKSWD